MGAKGSSFKVQHTNSNIRRRSQYIHTGPTAMSHPWQTCHRKIF